MKAPAAPDLGERMFLWRNVRGWSQDELARRSGVSRSAIATAETGRRQPRLSTVRRLAWTFGLTTEEFLHGEVSMRT